MNLVLSIQISFEYGTIPIRVIESKHSDDSLFSSWDESSSIGEEVQTIDGTEMAWHETYLLLVHNVHQMDLVSEITSSHSGLTSWNTSSHNKMELRIGGWTE